MKVVKMRTLLRVKRLIKDYIPDRNERAYLKGIIKKVERNDTEQKLANLLIINNQVGILVRLFGLTDSWNYLEKWFKVDYSAVFEDSEMPNDIKILFETRGEFLVDTSERQFKKLFNSVNEEQRESLSKKHEQHLSLIKDYENVLNTLKKELEQERASE